MSVPGENILLDALDVIESQTVQYRQFISRAVNDYGVEVNTYADVVTINIGSLQPLPKNRYQENGIDLQKQAVTWYVPQQVVGTARNTAGDRIGYNGRVYQLESDNDWFGQDGWVAIIGIQIEGTEL